LPTHGDLGDEVAGAARFQAWIDQRHLRRGNVAVATGENPLRQLRDLDSIGDADLRNLGVDVVLLVIGRRAVLIASSLVRCRDGSQH
jgi:hypothetical protein